MSAASPPARGLAGITRRIPSVPPPDSREGRVLIVALLAAVIYILLLVGVNTPLADRDGAWVPLILLLGTIVTFGLAAMLGADHARARIVELELARTVAVHSGSGQAPEENSPLGRVLSEYARSADEMRRHARIHSYAAGPALWGTATALIAALLWGLSFTTGTVWVNYLAIVVELPAIAFLFFSVAVLALGIGWDRAVDGFSALTPSRWRTHEARSEALQEAIVSLPWLGDSFGTDHPAPPPTAKAPSPWAEEAAA